MKINKHGSYSLELRKHTNSVVIGQQVVVVASRDLNLGLQTKFP